MIFLNLYQQYCLPISASMQGQDPSDSKFVEQVITDAPTSYSTPLKTKIPSQESSYDSVNNAQRLKVTLEELFREKLSAKSLDKPQTSEKGSNFEEMLPPTTKKCSKMFIVLADSEQNQLLKDLIQKAEGKIATISIESDWETLLNQKSHRKQIKSSKDQSSIPLLMEPQSGQNEKKSHSVAKDQQEVNKNEFNDNISLSHEKKQGVNKKNELDSISNQKIVTFNLLSDNKFSDEVSQNQKGKIRRSSKILDESGRSQKNSNSLQQKMVNSAGSIINDNELDKAFVDNNLQSAQNSNSKIIKSECKSKTSSKILKQIGINQLIQTTPKKYKARKQEQSNEVSASKQISRSYQTSFDINTTNKDENYESHKKYKQINKNKGDSYEEASYLALDDNKYPYLYRSQGIYYENRSKKIKQALEPKTKKYKETVEGINSIDNEPFAKKSFKASWEDYLQCLSYPQTELTYLCQKMEFSLKFFEKNAQIGVQKYECRIEVGVIKSGIYRKYYGTCQAAQGKKAARHYAAVHCLADLFSSIDGLWERCKEFKQQNEALIQPLKGNNIEILDMFFKNRKIEQKKCWKLEDQIGLNQNIDVDKYIKELKSCKKQMYYFVGQHNKVFMNPKWIIRKPNILGLWEAEGYVRYELQDKIYEYRYKNKGRSKKESEEKVSECILRNMYRDFPGLFKRFRKIKLERGFS